MESTEIKLTALLSDPGVVTIAALLAGFTAMEDYFRQKGDSRAIFLGAYVIITRAMEHAIETEQFADPYWVRRYLLQFGGLYMGALRASEEGRVDAVPAAWRVAFDLSKRGSGTTLQHLLLGINAHVNHDLAHALVQAGLDADPAMRYRDHTAINAVLQQATRDLQRHVERFYAPALYLLDVLCGPLDQEIADLLVDRARETAWEHGLALHNAADEEARTAMRRRINDHAGALAELIAHPTHAPHDILAALKDIF